jgi:hypothetical protein
MFELFQSDALPPPKLSFAFAHQLCLLRGQNIVGINRFLGDDDLLALPESAHGGHYVSFGSAAPDIHTLRLSDSRHRSKRLCWTHACNVSSALRPFQ